MERHFKGYSVQHIPRDDNNEADKLAKAAARNQELPLMYSSKSSENHLSRNQGRKS
jgi:hypothetical protein